MKRAIWTTIKIVLVAVFVALADYAICVNADAATIKVPGKVEGVKLETTGFVKCFDISWKKPVNADKNTVYEVWAKHEGWNNNKYSKIATLRYNMLKLRYVNEKIDVGETTWIKIRAYNTKTKQYGAYSSPKSMVTKPSAPAKCSAYYDDYSDQIIINWSKASGHTTTYVYYKYTSPATKKSTKWTRLVALPKDAKNTYTWHPSKAGNYKFCVRTYNKNSKTLSDTSGYSKTVEFN